MSENETMSVWEAHKATNAKLLEMGLDKTLPPQMFYNYTTARLNKGQTPLIPSERVDGKTIIKVTDFVEWLEKYLKKNIITKIAQ